MLMPARMMGPNSPLCALMDPHLAHGLDPRRPGIFLAARSRVRAPRPSSWASRSRSSCGLGASVAGKGGIAHLPVFLGPASERGILGPEFLCEVDGSHLPARHRPGGRDLEPLVVALPSSGHSEHLSPLIWCPENNTLSTPMTSSWSRITTASPI